MNLDKEYALFLEEIFDCSFDASPDISILTEKLLGNLKTSTQEIIRMKFKLNEEKRKFTEREIISALKKKYGEDCYLNSSSRIRTRISDAIRRIRLARYEIELCKCLEQILKHKISE